MAGSGEGPRWKNVLRGRSVWVSPDPSPEEVAELEREFPRVIRVPENELRDEVARWEDTVMVARCFGRWVAPDAVVREFHRVGIAGEVQAFGLACGYYIFNFPSTGKRVKVVDRPWTVNGQILAVEEWRRAFLPSEEAITSALVWVLLSHLPVEMWGEAALQRLVKDAGEFVMVDEFTLERRRLGFARVCIQVDLSRLLLPGVRIDDPNGIYWQRYAYENLNSLCPDYGVVVHLRGRCSKGVDREMPTEADGSLEVAGEGERRDPIRRGAWMVAVRQWMMEAGAPLLPGMSESLGGKAAVQTAAAVAGVWRQPAKVARRGKSPPFPPLVSGKEAAVGGGGSRGRASARGLGTWAGPEGRPNNQFQVLGQLGEDGLVDSGPGNLALPKRARLQSSPVGQASRSRSTGDGSVQPRKSGLSGPSLDLSKGKGLAMPGNPVAAPVSEVFQFVAGEGEDSSSLAVPPPVCPGPSTVVEQLPLEKGEVTCSDVPMGGGGHGSPHRP